MKQIETTHDVIGYSENVEIIQQALRCVGFQDNSHVGTALAAHVWSVLVHCQVPATRTTEKGYSFGEAEVEFALSSIEARVKVMREHFESIKECKTYNWKDPLTAAVILDENGFVEYRTDDGMSIRIHPATNGWEQKVDESTVKDRFTDGSGNLWKLVVLG